MRYLMTRWMWNQHPYMKMLPDVVLTKMRLETTLKSLDEMPPVYRTALILRVQGYSIKEIAHITNSSAAAVKTRIHRARQLLLQNSQNDP